MIQIRPYGTRLSEIASRTFNPRIAVPSDSRINAVQSPGSASWASSSGIRKSMQSNRGKDTALEVSFRSRLHRAGLRFRKHRHPLPDFRCEADVVFPRERLAIFIDGCFWHG